MSVAATAPKGPVMAGKEKPHSLAQVLDQVIENTEGARACCAQPAARGTAEVAKSRGASTGKTVALLGVGLAAWAGAYAVVHSLPDRPVIACTVFSEEDKPLAHRQWVLEPDGIHIYCACSHDGRPLKVRANNDGTTEISERHMTLSRLASWCAPRSSCM